VRFDGRAGIDSGSRVVRLGKHANVMSLVDQGAIADSKGTPLCHGAPGPRSGEAIATGGLNESKDLFAIYKALLHGRVPY
jgi:hypothetical protein